jgi:hypothetical protein
MLEMLRSGMLELLENWMSPRRATPSSSIVWELDSDQALPRWPDRHTPALALAPFSENTKTRRSGVFSGDLDNTVLGFIETGYGRVL